MANLDYARFDSRTIGNIRVHVCASDKFKTTTLMAFIQQDLTPETVTKTALLPNVLQRGTASVPTTIALKRKLDDLFGAVLYGDVFKRGERHIMQFALEIANEQYLREAPKLLAEGVQLLSDVLLNPVLENKALKASYVEAEKKNLKQKIESLKDDKIRYASYRMIEAMCEGEPYALFNHGRVEDLAKIDPQNLYTYYQEVLTTCPIDFYCVGNVTVDEVVELLENQFAGVAGTGRKTIQTESVMHPVAKERVVIERMNVKQGKLNIGCRTQTSIQDEDYPALLMYNGILGGFPHSKLFRNVREKASLAYYCSSRLESHKGLLAIQSGIEISNYEQAVNIIRQQLEDMRQGKIEEQELEQTKATLSNQLRSQMDRSYEMIFYHYQAVLSGKQRPLEQLLEQISRVNKEDVQKIAEKVQLDTIYFLRDRGGNEDAKS
ncbi:MAG: pitrilysin family protein [Thermoactinomyces sp.]